MCIRDRSTRNSSVPDIVAVISGNSEKSTEIVGVVVPLLTSKPVPTVTLVTVPTVSESVKLNTPVELLYEISPLPLNNALICESVRSVKLNAPVLLLYAKSPPALNNALISELLTSISSAFTSIP